MGTQHKSIRGALARWWGYNLATPVDTGIRNNEAIFGKSASGKRGDRSTNIEALMPADAEDQVRLYGSKVTQKAQPITFYETTADAVATKRFFTNPLPFAVKVVGVRLKYSTAESTATTLTAQVTKDDDGSTAGSGTSLLATALDPTAAAATEQVGTLVTDNLDEDSSGPLWVQQNESLSFKLSEASTELAGVALTIYVVPAGGYKFATYVVTPNADLADSTFFVANRPTRIKYAAFQAATAASATATVQLTKDAATDLPGAGTDLLSTAFDAEGTINTTQAAALVTTAATVRFAAGDRLSVDFSATTGLGGVCITVALETDDDLIDVTFFRGVNADQVDGYIFNANRKMVVEDARATWSTAAGAGGNAQINHQIGTQTAEQGTALLTNDSNAGFPTDGTADTPVAGAFVAAGLLEILDSDSLGIDYNATVASLVGFCCTITLRLR